MPVKQDKHEIIDFIKHSSEEENLKIAIFIERMKAEKEADLSKILKESKKNLSE